MNYYVDIYFNDNTVVTMDADDGGDAIDIATKACSRSSW